MLLLLFPLYLRCQEAGKAKLMFTSHSISFCFVLDPEEYSAHSKHRFLLHLKERKQEKKNPKLDSAWVSELDHRAFISFKQRWSGAHTEARGIFISWPLHEFKANTQTTRSTLRYFTAMPFLLEYVWKSAMDSGPCIQIGQISLAWLHTKLQGRISVLGSLGKGFSSLALEETLGSNRRWKQWKRKLFA